MVPGHSRGDGFTRADRPSTHPRKHTPRRTLPAPGGSPTGGMAELLERLDRWGLHPEVVVSDTFALSEAGDAYALADGGTVGKVGIVWP